MKAICTLFVLALATMFAGCTTSSQVQNLIDAKHRDYLSKAESQQASIDVLKKSAFAALEKSKENGEALVQLKADLQTVLTQLKIVQGYAEASKVMSAANTVNVANLEEAVSALQDQLDSTADRFSEIDMLHEDVLIANYQTIASSANAAIQSLKENGWAASTNAPVLLDEPIEIVAPDTSVAAPAAE